MSALLTLRARLYFAFGFAAAMTVVGSLIALYTFNDVGSTTTEIVSHSTPAMVQSLRLAEETSSVLAAAPRIMAARTDAQRSAVAAELKLKELRLSALVADLIETAGASAADIDRARAAMTDRLYALDRTVAERISISEQRQKLTLSVRKLHEEFLEQIAPVIDDANFDLVIATRTGLKAGSVDLVELLRRSLEIQAEVNLLAGLLTEASMAGERARLQPLRDLMDAARRKIDGNISAMSGVPQRQKLADLYRRMAAIADKDGIPALRDRELSVLQDAERTFAATQSEAVKLKQAVEQLVEAHGQNTRQLALRAEQKIKSGRWLLIVLAVAAAAAAALVAWLFVHRNLVRRLGALSQAMRQIAGGDTSITIRDDGRDEIADMAKALIVFRDATVEVGAARMKEAKSASEAEARRRLFDKATANFERAVTEIVGALSEASKNMNDSATTMTMSARNNQSHASATAAAAEETTANVENLASAAEEIASSVDHIATQVRDSAGIARRAAGDAQVVRNIVENLTNSVSQIGDISQLIQGIAAQTNLLALNATIEAARAGEAGRGFAVVAQEVKTLADQTSKATANIGQQIASIETTTIRAVDAMKEISHTITRMDEIAGTVASAVEQQGGVTQEIARTAAMVAEGTREVSANVTQSSQAAVEMDEVAAAVSKAAAALSERSHTLAEAADAFLRQVRAA